MRRAWGLLVAATLCLSGCELPGARSTQGVVLDEAERGALAATFREFLSSQQARQQVNVTATSLIADNSAGLISNNGSSLVSNMPLVANNTGGLVSNGGSTYRLAATREKAPAQHHLLADGSHFYRIGNPTQGDTLVESFVTRGPNVAASGFDVPDADILMHARMVVNLQDYDPVTIGDQPITNSYHIEVVKSPVFSDYRNEVEITAPPLGRTLRYLSSATYMLGALPVTAQATHSAFAPFVVDGQTMDLPTSGEERIRVGTTLLDLSYQNVSGQGVGSGTWRGATNEVWPLTYSYDFSRNQAEMRVTLPQDRVLKLDVQPGMQVMAGKALTKDGETIATLAKREDGALVLHFNQGESTVLFE